MHPLKLNVFTDHSTMVMLHVYHCHKPSRWEVASSKNGKSLLEIQLTGENDGKYKLMALLQ